MPAPAYRSFPCSYVAEERQRIDFSQRQVTHSSIYLLAKDTLKHVLTFVSTPQMVLVCKTFYEVGWEVLRVSANIERVLEHCLLYNHMQLFDRLIKQMTATEIARCANLLLNLCIAQHKHGLMDILRGEYGFKFAVEHLKNNLRYNCSVMMQHVDHLFQSGSSDELDLFLEESYMFEDRQTHLETFQQFIALLRKHKIAENRITQICLYYFEHCADDYLDAVRYLLNEEKCNVNAAIVDNALVGGDPEILELIWNTSYSSRVLFAKSEWRYDRFYSNKWYFYDGRFLAWILRHPTIDFPWDRVLKKVVLWEQPASTEYFRKVALDFRSHREATLITNHQLCLRLDASDMMKIVQRAALMNNIQILTDVKNGIVSESDNLQITFPEIDLSELIHGSKKSPLLYVGPLIQVFGEPALELFIRREMTVSASGELHQFLVSFREKSMIQAIIKKLTDEELVYCPKCTIVLIETVSPNLQSIEMNRIFDAAAKVYNVGIIEALSAAVSDKPELFKLFNLKVEQSWFANVFARKRKNSEVDSVSEKRLCK